MTPRRLKLVLVLAGLVLAALTLLAWTQPWFVLAVRAPQGGSVDVTSDGDVAGGALAALALASLALVGALTIAGVVFRVVLGVLQALLGVCVALSALLAVGDPVGVSGSAVTAATGVDGSRSLDALVTSVVTTGWPWLGLVAGLLTVLHGAAVALTARRWPAATRKYQAVRLEQADPSHDPAAAWDSLSGGDDPTAGQADGDERSR